MASKTSAIQKVQRKIKKNRTAKSVKKPEIKAETTQTMKRSLNTKTIVWVTSEAVPYAKSGGLADVSGALPAALAERGHHVYVIMPYYPKLMGKYNHELKVRHQLLGVPFCGRTEWAQLLEHKISNRLSYIFIEYHHFFDRSSLYDWNGTAYGDNPERFIFFCRAAMQAVLALELNPDILHVNDWHAALCSVYLISHLYRNYANFANCASVLTIHNVAYQGTYNKSYLYCTGLGWEYFNYHCLEFYDNISFLKAGIMTSHMVNTVSPSYALEILSPYHGYLMDSALRERAAQGAFHGILNGIDVNVWNPETDKFIPKNFSKDNMSGKKTCKAELQKMFSLPQRPDSPLFGIVSRLVYQKGIDIFANAVQDMLLYDDVQFVIIGTGESWLQNRLCQLAAKYPAKLGIQIGYSDETAHLIEAGCDFFVMPSRYEPCGLNQMYSAHYGTAPIVRATGGLDDTVCNFDISKPWISTGFKFWDLNPQALLNTMRWAASIYRLHPKEFRQMQINAMSQDFSWNHTASLYEKLYDEALSFRKK